MEASEKKTVGKDGVPTVSVIAEKASRRPWLEIRDPEGLLAAFPGTGRVTRPSGPRRRWTGASLAAEAGGSSREELR